MTTRGLPLPRKKACYACSAAKAKCDHRRPRCERCRIRNSPCKYVEPPQGVREVRTPESSYQSSHASTRGTGLLSPDAYQASLLSVGPSAFSPSFRNDVVSHQRDEELLDFVSVSLLPLAESERIRDRWLDPFISPPFSQHPKSYAPRTIAFIRRILKSYTKMLLRPDGDPPPFIHPLQFSTPAPPALSNCVSLVRMWWGRAIGSEKIVMDTMEREMARLLQEYRDYDAPNLLAAFQAYLLYCIMPYFSSPSPSSSSSSSSSSTDKVNPTTGTDLTPLFTGTTLVHLQELAARISTTGLIHPAELIPSSISPPFESWIIAEARRRTLYVVYLLENVFQWEHENVVVRADELALLPAPAAKRLWEARTREAWRREWGVWVQGWGGIGGLRMGDFWPRMAVSDEEGQLGFEDEGREVLRARKVDKYAEEVDEFGMMMVGVCTLTHGS